MLNQNFLSILHILFMFVSRLPCSQYDYLLFENFELTGKIFVKETELVRNLEYKRETFYRRMQLIHTNLIKLSGVESYFKSTLVQIHKQIPKFKQDFKVRKIHNSINLNKMMYNSNVSHSNYYNPLHIREYIYSYDNLYNLTAEQITIASLKGIVMLHESYMQDIKDYSKGHIRLKRGIETNSRKIDSLKPQDIAAMSSVAFNKFQWYDSGLKYLKEAIDMLYSISKEEWRNLPRNLEATLLTMKKYYPIFHNNVFSKIDTIIGPDWKVFPYTVNTETLVTPLNTSTEATGFDLVLHAIEVDRKKHQYKHGHFREHLFQNVCNGNIQGAGYLSVTNHAIRQPKCHFLHHFNTFLNLSPFRLEVKFYFPFRTVIHDFFTFSEMEWLKDYSKPRLSQSREIPASTETLTNAELKDAKNIGYTVGKAVQTWFDDIKYNEEEEYIKISSRDETLMYDVNPLTNPYSYTVHHEIMYRISNRIEQATNFNVTTRHGSSPYQTTNYGLSGMVQPHHDSWGYEKGVKLVEDRRTLMRTGDYIATFMGWFGDTKAGGNTAFISKHFEGAVKPNKGSAAFWMNLSACHLIDMRAIHGGCPVLMGSKWILNKWIYSYDQWKDWPCYTVQNISIFPFKGISV